MKRQRQSNPAAGAGPPCDIPGKVIGGLIQSAASALSGKGSSGSKAGSSKGSK